MEEFAAELGIVRALNGLNQRLGDSALLFLSAGSPRVGRDDVDGAQDSLADLWFSRLRQPGQRQNGRRTERPGRFPGFGAQIGLGSSDPNEELVQFVGLSSPARQGESGHRQMRDSYGQPGATHGVTPYRCHGPRPEFPSIRFACSSPMKRSLAWSQSRGRPRR